MIIRNADEITWTQNMDECDAFTRPEILENTYCEVPISALTVYPYYLPWGSSVYAQVQAYNSYGDSYFTEAGNGATIFTNPDAPINLQLDPTWTRTATQLAFQWEDGANDGGSSVVGYRIWYDQGVGEWVLLNDQVTTNYWLQNGLAFGLTY